MKQLFKELLLVSLLITIGFTMVGCWENSGTPTIPLDEQQLPSGAVVNQRLGNDWLVFTIKGNKYIYRMSRTYGGSTVEAIAPYKD